MSFKEYVPEDGQNWRPKHVAGYPFYITIYLHIFICTYWSISNSGVVTLSYLLT